MECWSLFFGHSAYLTVAIWLTWEDTGKPGLVFLFCFTLETLQRLQESAYLFESKPNLVAVPPSCRCRGLTWGSEVWNRLLTGCWAGALRSVLVSLWSGLCVLLNSALLTAAPDLPDPEQRALGVKFSTWIKCSKTWKLIFNNTVEMGLSCVSGIGDQVLVYTPGPCCRREVWMHSASVSTCLGVCFWRRNIVVV